MWQYVVRRLLYNIPVYLGIILILMGMLRVHDPVYAYLSKKATQQEYDDFKKKAGLDKAFHEQYMEFVGSTLTLDFSEESWSKPGKEVGDLLADAVIPSLAITLPALVLTAVISILVGLISAFYRGRVLDRTLVTIAVLGMSVSFLVYIIFGQYFGAYKLNEWAGKEIFAVQGYDLEEPNWWFHFCLLPVMISTIVAMGYDTRFYRAVMVEEVNKDYIRTARAKGASERRVMFVHMLKNALISIITRIMISLPFLVMGSILLETYFNIPGMGKILITAINSRDFPIIQAFTAVFAIIFIVSNILTDVLYALVDPRVRLS